MTNCRPSFEKSLYHLLANHRLKNLAIRSPSTLRNASEQLSVRTQSRNGSAFSSISRQMFSPQALFFRRSPKFQPPSPFSFITGSSAVTPSTVRNSNKIFGPRKTSPPMPLQTIDRNYDTVPKSPGQPLDSWSQPHTSKGRMKPLMGLGIVENRNRHTDEKESERPFKREYGSIKKAGVKVRGSRTDRENWLEGGDVGSSQVGRTTKQHSTSPHIKFATPVKPERIPTNEPKSKTRRLKKNGRSKGENAVLVLVIGYSVT